MPVLRSLRRLVSSLMASTDAAMARSLMRIGKSEADMRSISMPVSLNRRIARIKKSPFAAISSVSILATVDLATFIKSANSC